MLALSFDDPLTNAWVFYSGVLLLKMLAMSMLTGMTRMKNKAFANVEDGAMLKVKPRMDDKVERIRRAHLNDIENIPPFIVCSFLYILTGPSYTMTMMLLRTATACRFVHTFVYAIMPMPQPARAIAFVIPYVITMYMVIQAVLAC